MVPAPCPTRPEVKFKIEIAIRLMNREVLPFATRLLNEKSPPGAGP